MSALCIWGKYKPAKRKSGFIPLPGATETYDSAAPYEHFDLVPPQGENMSLEDFLSAYSELFEPFVDPIRSHKVKANEDSCCHACTEASCSMRENLQNYNEITLSVSSVWEDAHRPAPFAKRHETAKIHLKDVRFNHRATTLHVTYTNRYLCPDKRAVSVTLAPLQFFNQHLTSRLAVAIANLLHTYSAKVICEGYNLSDYEIRTVRNTWESFCDHSWNPSHDLWIAKNTIRDKEIFYLYDATDRVLLNVYDKSALQNAIEESVFYDPPVLFVSDTIDYFQSFSPDARRLFPVTPTFAIVDIHAFLFELFLQGVDRRPLATATLSHDEVYSLLLSAFETLKLLCKSSTEKLRSGVANQQTAERCKEDVFHQLRIISLLADAQSPQQIPLFPELLTAIRDILRGEIPVHWNPENYLRNSETTYFTPRKIGSLKRFLDFVRLVDEFFPEDADFETVISRLTTFNEAATTVVSYSEDSNGPQAESVFSRLTSNDFYQLHIPIRAVPIQCLSHLVRCGILDTETPFLNLPCIRDRIQNKWDAGCKIEKCPLLREPHAYTEQ